MRVTRPPYFAVAAAIVLAPLLLWKVIEYPIGKRPAPAHVAPPRDQAEANRQDLTYLRETLKEIDRSFSSAAWTRFDRTIDELLRNAGELTPAAFELGVAHALAAADNGHTNIRGVGWGLTLNALPLRFGWFAEGVFVIAADPAHENLLGARIIAVDGHTPEELADALHAYVGGPVSLVRELTPNFMTSPAALHAAGLAESPDSVELTLRSQDGNDLERTVAALPFPANGPPAPYRGPRDPRERWPRRALSPLEVPHTAHAWLHVLGKQARLPLSLQHPASFYWRTLLPEANAVYVQINAVADQPGTDSLRTFLQLTLEEISNKRPAKTIIDLRGCSGGNYALTAQFTRALPKAMPPGGRIFVLTSGNTFSAAIITAARLKYYSEGSALLVGERMGDREQFWAEAATRISLPNSHLVATYATGYHDWERGCSVAQLLICAPENLYLGVAAGKLTPAAELRWSFADYLRAEDTVLQAVLRSSVQQPQNEVSENRS